jgi:hypothetical protein
MFRIRITAFHLGDNYFSLLSGINVEVPSALLKLIDFGYSYEDF